MKTGAVVIITLRYYTLLAALLTARPDTAFGQLFPYDNFNTSIRVLNPDKWRGYEAGAIGLESSVRIDAGKLRMSHRAYGDTASDAGLLGSSLGLYMPDPNSIRAIQADVEVVEFEAGGCTANPAVTESRVELRGAFFNTSTPVPGSSIRDVHAVIYMVRRATDVANRLQSEAQMIRCTNATCSTSDSFQQKSLGFVDCPGRICPLQTLLIQWEPQNNLFRFRRNTTEQTISYALADTNLPGAPSRTLYVAPIVENCTAARQRGFIEVLIDNVLTD